MLHIAPTSPRARDQDHEKNDSSINRSNLARETNNVTSYFGLKHI
jgi:hypothetical protein